MNRKIIFLALGLLAGLTQIKPADNKAKRPAEEQDGPASQQENKSRKIDLQEQFFRACETGDIERVEQLLKQGLSLTETTPRGKGDSTITVLGVACLNGHNNVVQRLLAAGVDPTAKHAANGDEASSTALGIVSICGHNNIMQTLLADPRVDPTAIQLTNPDGSTLTALGIVSMSNRSNLVQTLLADPRVDPTAIHSNYANGTTITALGIASLYGHNNIMQTLLADPRVSCREVKSTGENAYQITNNDKTKELIQQHQAREQAIDPISTVNFKKNQLLQILPNCLHVIQKVSVHKLLPRRCPMCRDEFNDSLVNSFSDTFEYDPSTREVSTQTDLTKVI